MKETSITPGTNIISERDFAHLDRKLVEKPNISTVAVTGHVMFAQNKTFSWLNQLSDDKRHQYFERARKEAPHAIQQYR